MQANTAKPTAPNDDKLLAEACRVLDNLYQNYQQEDSHE